MPSGGEPNGGTGRFIFMIDALTDILRDYPTLALFLTLGLGFMIGKARIGTFSLGSVTSVLIVGVIVGQIGISMSGPLKTVFFMMFLFSIGYSVGPEFFKSLRGQGLRQVVFAVAMSSMCFAVTLAMAYLMGYGKGVTVGLFAGAQTCSSILGVGGEAIAKLPLPQQEIKQELDIIPVCYAVTYIFGTLGTVIMLGNFGPGLLGGIEKVKKLTRELEGTLDGKGVSDNPAFISAMNVVTYRAYLVESEMFREPLTVQDAERYLRSKGLEVFIDRVRRGDYIFVPRFDDRVYIHDSIVVGGRKEYMVSVGKYIGHETADVRLLGYAVERVGVVVAKRGFEGRQLSGLRKEKFMHGVSIRDGIRDGKMIEIGPATVFEPGDRLTIVGRGRRIKRAAAQIGHLDKPTVSSDLMFVGLAIFVGGLLGALSFWVGDVPVGLGTSGGALVAGLVFGWLRSRRPTYGQIPPSALWIMNNLGLNVFIAVVGIEAAPSFVAGLKVLGPLVFAVGAVCTLVPLAFGLWLGQKVFRFNPAITLGCCAGTRTCTAALGAVQDTLGSTVPAIGYAVTYAVSNLLLVVWGMLAVGLA